MTFTRLYMKFQSRTNSVQKATIRGIELISIEDILFHGAIPAKVSVTQARIYTSYIIFCKILSPHAMLYVYTKGQLHCIHILIFAGDNSYFITLSLSPLSYLLKSSFDKIPAHMLRVVYYYITRPPH